MNLASAAPARSRATRGPGPAAAAAAPTAIAGIAQCRAAHQRQQPRRSLLLTSRRLRAPSGPAPCRRRQTPRIVRVQARAPRASPTPPPAHAPTGAIWASCRTWAPGSAPLAPLEHPPPAAPAAVCVGARLRRCPRAARRRPGRRRAWGPQTRRSLLLHCPPPSRRRCPARGRAQLLPTKPPLRATRRRPRRAPAALAMRLVLAARALALATALRWHALCSSLLMTLRKRPPPRAWTPHRARHPPPA